MANIFTDRVATRPNRFKITPDSGSAYFATMERADEPTVVGTAISATNLNKLLDRNGDTMLGNLAMNGNKVTGLGTPTANTDAATKAYVDSKNLASLGVTATAAELNKLDGVTASTAELNIMDGITATTAELNYCDGVTSNIQTQLNGKQSTIGGAASTIASSNLTASRALVSDTNGKVAVSAVTSTELGYLDGVTSAIQTQLNGKQSTVVGGASTIVSNNLTASRALVSNTDGKVGASGITATELNYLDGVSSNIQTQLNGKAASGHNHSGVNIEPTAIELKPGSIADHGGYIDFHYQNDSGDYTSRIVESAKGIVTLNDSEILTRKKVIGVYSYAMSFSNGIGKYENSSITAPSCCIAQIRSSSNGNGQLLTTTSYNGYVQVVGPTTLTGTKNVNIIIIIP